MTPKEWLSIFTPALLPFSRIMQNEKAAPLLFFSASSGKSALRAAILLMLATICQDDLFELISALTGKSTAELAQMSTPAIVALFPVDGIRQLFSMHARGNDS